MTKRQVELGEQFVWKGIKVKTMLASQICEGCANQKHKGNQSIDTACRDLPACFHMVFIPLDQVEAHTARLIAMKLEG